MSRRTLDFVGKEALTPVPFSATSAGHVAAAAAHGYGVPQCVVDAHSRAALAGTHGYGLSTMIDGMFKKANVPYQTQLYENGHGAGRNTCATPTGDAGIYSQRLGCANLAKTTRRLLADVDNMSLPENTVHALSMRPQAPLADLGASFQN